MKRKTLDVESREVGRLSDIAIRDEAKEARLDARLTLASPFTFHI